jgi:membrane-bound lytic murein transglycosylase A
MLVLIMKLTLQSFPMVCDFKHFAFHFFLGLIFAGCSHAAYKPEFAADDALLIADDLNGAPQKNTSAIYRPVEWSEIDGWYDDNHAEALAAFMKSCKAIAADSLWDRPCFDAAFIDENDTFSARIFFESRFQPYEIIADGNERRGLITGYYIPILEGSREKTERFKYPIYKRPSDLVLVDLASFGADRKYARGILGKNGIVTPYPYDREAIETNASLLKGSEIFYVDDPIALFFMHIQGSGLIKVGNKTRLVGYADQNGFSYYAIGKYFVDTGKISRDNLSMQTIRAWLSAQLAKNPKRAFEVMWKNRSFIFFEEKDEEGAVGSLGVVLSPKRSIAVDKSFIPLGSPVFIAGVDEKKEFKLNMRRLIMAQDTGGAIKGAARADFFWGVGREAGKNAGAMRLYGRFWLLAPKNY